MKVISREVFVTSPAAGTGVLAYSYYTRAQGLELLETHQFIRRSDTFEAAHRRRSLDNGQNWSEPEIITLQENKAQGKLRRILFPGFVDDAGRLVTLRVEGVLPTDNPLEGMQRWQLFYTVSEDGGRTDIVDKQIIQDGEEYSATHPLPGVWTGKNAIQIGAFSCVPLTLPDGTILVPSHSPPLGPGGESFNPGGGYTYTDVLVLRGRRQADKSLAWEASQRVTGDPQKSTRGLVEPVLALLEDGKVMVVMRGSNDANHDLPGYKWVSFSSDEGRSWSTPCPWTYDDGTPFFSPSSCSQLLAHSSGQLLWFGNIAPHNPIGNKPRHPLMAGEVDRNSGLLLKKSLATIGERGSEDGDDLQLSNFYAREDRATGEIVLHISPLFSGGRQDMTADAMVYRLSLEP